MRPIRREADFHRLGAVLPDVVDPRVGLVREVFEVSREAGDPDFFHFYAQACNTSAFTGQQNFYSSGGASSDRRAALAKAIGEAIERYCSAIFDTGELPLFAASEAPFPCAAPDLFAHYSASQYASPTFPFVPFDPSTRVRWVPAVDALTREPVFVPAAKVYVPYTYYLGTGDAPICQPISTGLACHMSPAEAAIGAICEVIERDAVTLTWQANMAPPHLRVETLSDANYDLVGRFERTGGRVTLFDITTDVSVPTILSALRYDSPDRPALVVAASTALNPETAVRKSLEELAHTRRYSQQIVRSLPRLEPRAPFYDNVIDQISHLNFWCDPRNAHHTEFLFASKKRVEFGALQNRSTGEAASDMDELARAVASTGHRALIADLTTADAAELGFSVVRAIIPGFHPLALGFSLRARGGRRLYEIPQRLGQRGITCESDENPIPHPYP